MSDKTKNIITVIVGLLLVIFICWYIVLAWELRASKDVISEFQTTIDWIKDVRAKIEDNSNKRTEKDQKIKTLEQQKIDLHNENEQLRQTEEEAISWFLEGLWLIESRQAQ